MQSVNGMLELFMKIVNSELGCQENVASDRELTAKALTSFSLILLLIPVIFSNFPFG